MDATGTPEMLVAPREQVSRDGALAQRDWPGAVISRLRRSRRRGGCLALRL